MRRPPRSPDEPLLPRPLVLWAALQGVLAFALTAAVFLTAHTYGMPEDEMRALTFFSLVFIIVSLIFVNRSFSSSLVEAFTRSNRTLILVTIFMRWCWAEPDLARGRRSIPLRPASWRRPRDHGRRGAAVARAAGNLQISAAPGAEEKSASRLGEVT